MIPFDVFALPDLGERALMLVAAILLDAIAGDPDQLWKRLKHPVAVIGDLIGWCDRTLNRDAMTAGERRRRGIATIGSLILLFGALSLLASAMLAASTIGLVLEVILVAILLAGRSLHEHVKTVAVALRDDSLAAARRAVSMIVGRDPEKLDESGVSRAAIESVAENFADGVVAPAFWFLVAGLPGIVVYKLINTADSMVGHKTQRHREFGWAAARIDDLVNLIPARISGVLIATAGALTGNSLRDSLTVMWRDAGKHASPNAGWPETAMAGALGIALAGPRKYAEYTSSDPWLNQPGRKVTNADDIFFALKIIIAASTVQAVIVAGVALIVRLA